MSQSGNPTVRPAVVFFATQPGATRTTFDRERCHREVIRPSIALLQANVVYQIVFVILCYQGDEGSEEGWPEYLREQDPPPHHVTSTSKELIASMRRERADRDFEYLNVSMWKGMPESVVGCAVGLARNQGANAFLVYPPGSPFPTPEEVEDELRRVHIGQTRTVEAPVLAAA